MAPRKVPAGQEQTLVAEYTAGASLEALSVTFGCSTGTIRNTLLRQGVARRPCGHKPKPVTPTKVCSSCGDELPRRDFYGDGKRSSECRKCLSSKSGDKYENDPDYRQKKIDSAKAWQTLHPAKSRARKRMWASGWTQERFDAAWKSQRGRCAICSVPMVEQGRGSNAVHSDHDHETGTVRGLLCAHCNRGLGSFSDSPDILRLAALYLEKHQS
jgi:hypothetical protein